MVGARWTPFIVVVGREGVRLLFLGWHGRVWLACHPKKRRRTPSRPTTTPLCRRHHLTGIGGGTGSGAGSRSGAGGGVEVGGGGGVEVGGGALYGSFTSSP